MPCCWSKSILAPLCFTGFFAIDGLCARSHKATDFKGIADCKLIHLNDDDGGRGRGEEDDNDNDEDDDDDDDDD